MVGKGLDSGVGLKQWCRAFEPGVCVEDTDVSAQFPPRDPDTVGLEGRGV